MIKKYVTFTIGILLSCLFLWLSSRGINFRLFLSSINDIGLGIAFACSVTYILNFTIRGLRSYVIFNNGGSQISFRAAFYSVVVSYGLNNILPFKGGEAYRCFYLKKYEKIYKSSAFGYIFIERLFDGISVLLIMLVSLQLIKNNEISKYIGLIQNISIILIVFAFSFVGIFTFSKKFIKSMIEKISSKANSYFIDYLIEKVKNIYSCFSIMKNLKNLFLIFLLSISIWLVESLVFYYIVSQYQGAFIISTLWMSFLALSFLLPSAPGNIGIFQYVSIVVLGALGIGKTEALSYAVFAHLVQYVPITLFAFLVLNFSSYLLGKDRSADIL